MALGETECGEGLDCFERVINTVCAAFTLRNTLPNNMCKRQWLIQRIKLPVQGVFIRFEKNECSQSSSSFNSHNIALTMPTDCHESPKDIVIQL